MSILNRRAFWGGLLILGGIVLLLQNLGVLPFSNLIFALLFVAAGLVFLAHLASSPRANWWAVIPGLILGYLGVLILMDQLAPGFSDLLGGGLFLFMIGLAFAIVYIIHRDFWWAIIPAGVMTTLAVVTWTSEWFEGEAVGGIFFLGLALTFAVLSVVQTPAGKMRWPLIPAGILAAMGVILVALSSTILNYVWPVALIGAGLFLFFYRGMNRA